MRLLFDLDGTLTDPFVGITTCIQHALERLEKVPPPAEELKWCIGPPLEHSFQTLLGTDETTFIAEAIRLYRERFGTVGLFENEVYARIPETLQNLSEKGFSMSVATSKPTIFAKRIIQHFELDEYFTAIDGSELDGTCVDKTSLIRHILHRDQLNPSEVVMIGDRKYDMIGAKENGIYGIGALWGHGSVDELQSAGANECIESPSELSSAITRAAQNLSRNQDR